MPEARSRRLAISVRPGRVAVLVDDEARWQPKAMRMLETFARKWGGVADILAPVVAMAIADPFWELLADFDPDWLGYYAPTRRGQQMANAVGFEKWLDETSAATAAANNMQAADVKRMLLEDLDSPLGVWPHDANPIDRELTRRLAPIHRLDLVVGQRFQANGKTEIPLTDLLGIRDLPGTELHQLDASGIDEDLDLMLALRFGAIGPSYEKALSERGVTVTRTKAEADDVRALIGMALAGGITPGDWAMHKAYRSHLGKPLAADPPWADPEYWSKSAFGWSSFSCGWRQYLRKLPLEWPFILVVGDSFSDFCLGLALQRLASNAIWIPTRLVVGEGELRDDVRQEVIDFLDDWARRSDQDVHVVSLSLKEAELNAVVDGLRAARRMAPLSGEHVHAKRFKETKRGWPRRLYDQRADEIRYEPFENGIMVGTLSTPCLPSLA